MSKFDDDSVAVNLIRELYTAVGAFFSNTRRAAPEICVVCTGPANTANNPPLCSQCRSARQIHGTKLADLVVPLAYAKGRMPSMHQSAHHLREYKAQPPALKCSQDLQLMAATATYLHGGCISALVGPWHSVTFVPSTRSVGRTQPIADIARKVHSVYPSTTKVGLGIGPGCEAAQDRVPRADRFFVPAEYVSSVAAKHVLVVEDTWVSGSKAQSAGGPSRADRHPHGTV